MDLVLILFIFRDPAFEDRVQASAFEAGFISRAAKYELADQFTLDRRHQG
jgi:hypothetical protein